MMLAIIILLAFVLALVCALKRRFRWALAAMFAGPVLMLLLLCPLLVWSATMGDCPDSMSLVECLGGLWLGPAFAATVGAVWFGAGALGFFCGWVATRVGATPQQ